MKLSFQRYAWRLTPPFYMGTADEATDSYTEWLRSCPAENSMVDFVIKASGRGGKLLDIGANFGLLTLSAAAAGMDVLAVEPLPRNYATLIRSIVKNGFHNVRAIHAAISEKTGTLFMKADGPWTLVSPNTTSLEVPSLTLDDLTAAFGWRDATIVKMDIEGSELAALDGGAEFLAHSPDVLWLFECNAYCSALFRYDYRTVLRKFEESGFDLYLFLGGSLIPRRADDFQELVSTDYVAVRKGRKVSVPGYSIRDLSLEEQVDLVMGQLPMSQQVEYAGYIFAAQDRMPRDLRRHPRIVAGLLELNKDTRPEFVAVVDQYHKVFN